ncbi:MAG: hypothetical protein K2K98_02330 [Muribaculaceae bacterium]|nr:hypothetical protein [Muribaculaceae bacterium]
MNNTWITFLNGILKMPGAKINRESFLRKTFKDLPEEKIRMCISDSPVRVLPPALIDSAASSIINSHAAKVTAISTVSGIPGGLALLATIPADMANYYYHIVSVGQKLGYLYGFPDMVDDKGKLTPDGEIMLTAFIGVMNKVQIANELIRKIATEMAKRLSEETARRIAGNILSKQLISQAIETVATKLGTQITSKSAGRGISKAIPIVSGIICGGLTYATFKPQSKRLLKTLQATAEVSRKLIPEPIEVPALTLEIKVSGD